MGHGVTTGTARGTWMKRVPLRHTDDGECMSSSVAWTSVPAPHQASSLYTPPSSTHLPHRGRHTADTEFNRPLHSNFSNSLSAGEWKEPGCPRLSRTILWAWLYAQQHWLKFSLCPSSFQTLEPLLKLHPAASLLSHSMGSEQSFGAQVKPPHSRKCPWTTGPHEQLLPMCSVDQLCSMDSWPRGLVARWAPQRLPQVSKKACPPL